MRACGLHTGLVSPDIGSLGSWRANIGANWRANIGADIGANIRAYKTCVSPDIGSHTGLVSPDIGSLLQPPVPEFREWATAAALRPVPHRLCCRFSEIWRDPYQESKTLMWDHTPRNPVWDWKRAGNTGW